MNNKDLFEKIITEKRAKSSNERPRYGLRKLTVGVVSCLLGYMMFMTPNVTLAKKSRSDTTGCRSEGWINRNQEDWRSRTT